MTHNGMLGINQLVNPLLIQIKDKCLLGRVWEVYAILIFLGWLPDQGSVASEESVMLVLDDDQCLWNVVAVLMELGRLELVLWGSEEEAYFAGAVQHLVDEPEMSTFALPVLSEKRWIFNVLQHVLEKWVCFTTFTFLEFVKCCFHVFSRNNIWSPWPFFMLSSQQERFLKLLLLLQGLSLGSHCMNIIFLIFRLPNIFW